MYSVIHNSNEVKLFETLKEAEAYITEVLERYESLNPVEIYRGYGMDNRSENPSRSGEIKSVVVYQYKTHYTETFVIFQKHGGKHTYHPRHDS